MQYKVPIAKRTSCKTAETRTEMDIRLQTEKELEYNFFENMIDDFPQNELKPLDKLKQLYQSGNYICYGLYDGINCMAYAYFLVNPNGRMKLLDYLAVSKACRGKGIGREFLEAVLKWEGGQTYVMIEVENPAASESEEERQMRNGRIAFYEKCGMHMTSVRTEAFYVPYCIMGNHEEVDEEILKKEYMNMYYTMAGLACDRKVRVL